MPLASIPSPSSSTIFEAGPIVLRWYGTLIAIGVLVAIGLTRREFVRRGLDQETVFSIATWAIPGGIIGARVYHVITDWSRFSGDLGEIPAIWHGGLGLPGVVMGGALATAIGARRNGIRPLVAFDCIAPGLVLAQAIGRWGNYFNQELFGGPTTLPWGLEIAPERRPFAYGQAETFHPTFLYESLWDLAVFVLVLTVSSRMWRRLPPGAIFAIYLCAYSFGRFWIEGLRVDVAREIGPLRLNQWLFGIVFVLTAVYLARLALRLHRSPDLFVNAGRDREQPARSPEA